MFWNRNKPKENELRIAEEFVASANGSVFKVQKYETYCGYDSYESDWNTKQVCSTMEQALDWVDRLRKQGNVNYHYL